MDFSFEKILSQLNQVTGTKEAFTKMLEERGVYQKLGVARSTVSNWKRAVNGNDDRNMPTLDQMEKMLEKYGATVAQEKVWNLPTSA